MYCTLFPCFLHHQSYIPPITCTFSIEKFSIYLYLYHLKSHNFANNDIVLHEKWFPGGYLGSRKVPAARSYIITFPWSSLYFRLMSCRWELLLVVRISIIVESSVSACCNGGKKETKYRPYVSAEVAYAPARHPLLCSAPRHLLLPQRQVLASPTHDRE